MFECREKLRPEYAHLAGPELGRRKREGEPVTEKVERPVFTYLGDTGPRVFDEHPEVGDSEILLMECTFVAPEHLQNARDTKHLHLQDICDRAELFRSQNSRIVSERYDEHYDEHHG